MLARGGVDGIVRQGVVMAVKNAFYAQSGGVTAVINGSACGVLQTARQLSVVRVFGTTGWVN
jgi:hypothetical protein